MRYRFGHFILDTQRLELSGAGRPIKLRRQAFQVLAYLLRHRERVVPTQELLEHLWPEQFVGDEALKSCVKALRKALGERGRTPHFVRTLYGQGYRFVAAVEECLPAPDAPPSLMLVPLAPLCRRACPAVVSLPASSARTAPRALASANRRTPAGHGAVWRCWRTRRRWRTSWAWRRAGTWSRRSARWPRSVCSAMRAPCRPSGTRVCWPCLACLWPRRNTPGAPCRRPWRCSSGSGQVRPERAVLPEQGLTAYVGVHTGWVGGGPPRDEPWQAVLIGGDTTQGALRLQALADPGSLVVSAMTLCGSLRSSVHSIASGLIRCLATRRPS